ncbi:MAG: hypothetical protein IPL51_10065 [Candidatus Competibacteraceae bacterium]|nr:hypothetical protein [Candidatus Competibacteraceae bacterium]
MSARIAYNETTAFGQQIAELMSALADAKNRALNLKASLDAMALGGTFAQIETEVGGMAAGTGETLYNILAGINQKLSSNTFDDVWKLYRG